MNDLTREKVVVRHLSRALLFGNRNQYFSNILTRMFDFLVRCQEHKTLAKQKSIVYFKNCVTEESCKY